MLKALDPKFLAINNFTDKFLVIEWQSSFFPLVHAEWQPCDDPIILVASLEPSDFSN